MAELATAGTVIGLVAVGAHLVRRVISLADDWGTAPASIEAVSRELSGLCGVLKQVDIVLKGKPGNFSPDVATDFQEVLNNCTGVFNRLSNIITKLKGVRSLIKRAKWLLKYKDMVGTIRNSLQAHKETLYITLLLILGSNTHEIMVQTEHIIATINAEPPAGTSQKVISKFLHSTASVAGATLISPDQIEEPLSRSSTPGSVSPPDSPLPEADNVLTEMPVDKTAEEVPEGAGHGSNADSSQDTTGAGNGTDTITQIITAPPSHTSPEKMFDDTTDPERDQEDGEALILATNRGDVKMTALLLEFGVNPNATGGFHGSPLQAAATGNHLDVIKLLLSKGASVNAEGHRWGNPLKAAITFNHEKAVQILLDNGADPNLSNALSQAAEQGNEAIVKMLLDRKADTETRGGFHGSALQAAAVGGHIPVLKLLLERGAAVNAQGHRWGDALKAAITFNQEAAVRTLLNAHADPNLLDALVLAANNGNKAIVTMLLDHGADPEQRGGFHGSPLQAAAAGGHIEVVKLLLAKGADADARGHRWGNPLKAAITFGHHDIQRLLLEHRALGK